MAFAFSNLAQAVWSDLGKVLPFHQFLASGGSTTTITNDDWTAREDGPEDNYCIDWTAVVVRDAAGASAAPEGELARITAYVASTTTYTIDAVSAAVASGDEILIANSDIPLREMYRICNRALTELGDIALVDTSGTTAASKTEYSLAVALKSGSPIKVEYQARTGDSDDNRWQVIPDASIEPAAPGSTGILRIPQLPAGRTIRIVYNGVHPTLTAYSSVISESIHPKLAIAAATAHALQWINGTQSGGTSYSVQRENKAWQDLEIAKAQHPIWKLTSLPKRDTYWMEKEDIEAEWL